MRKVIKKIDRSLSSVYGAISLLIFFVCYLAVGNIVDYFYGAKVAQTVIFNGPFFAFLLGLVTLSLTLSLFKRLPFKKRLIGLYTIHIGLIILFVSMMFSGFISHRGSIQLAPRSFVNKAYSDKYQISVTEKVTGLGQYIDLDFSIRPQGLNLDTGPIYLISYLPYSQISNDLVEMDGENSAVITVRSSSSKNLKPQQFYLSTNSLDYRSFYKKGDREFILLNSKMLDCIKDLRAVNASCAPVLVRRSLTKVKEDLCHSNAYLLTEEGIFSLADDCKLNTFKKSITLDAEEVSLDAFYRNKQFKRDFKASTDYKNSKNDVVKYQVKGDVGRLSTIFVNESKEIVDKEGKVYDFSFRHQSIKLPFSLYLNELQTSESKNGISLLDYKASVTIKDNETESDHFIELNSPLNVHGWSIYLDSVNAAQDEGTSSIVKMSLLYDPVRYIKIFGFAIFCLGLVILGFQRKIS